MATATEIAAKKKAKRSEKRSKRLSLDQIHMGPEPFWEEGVTSKYNKSEVNVEWTKAAHWYNYYYKMKDYIPYIIRYAEDIGFDSDQITALKACQDYKLAMNCRAIIRLHYRGWEHTEEQYARVKEHLLEQVEEGKVALLEKKEETKSAPPVISIAERTRRKMMDTIYAAWDETIVDGWMDKKYKEKLDVYSLFKEHQLKGNAIAPFQRIIQGNYDEISDALNKKCDQCVEAYSHITTANKKKMLKQMDAIFADLDSLKLSFKASKTPRIAKRKSTDDQVKNLKYKSDDTDYKIASINPVTIPGKETLFIFNTKNRTLYQYVTTATAGFEIGGTSIKNFEEKLSKCTRLRKPEDILPLILTKTPKQIESQVWKTVTTKVNPCNGRVNADCVLLRTL